jgi:predicted ArsR family transcriptional regulator
MRKTKSPRLTTAERVADLLKELAASEDCTVEELAAAMGTRKNQGYKWMDAFEEVGIVEKGTARKKSPSAKGSPAATYKLAKWIKNKVT